MAVLLLVAILTPTGGGAGAAEPTCPTPGAGWRRVAGADRFGTAAALLADAAPTGPVYVAGIDGISDALAAAPAAAAAGGGLLFVDRDTVPSATRVALAATRPPIVVVGGSQAVSPAVVRELARINGGRIEQVAGADRYATAVALARTVAGDTILLAGGDGFADALAAGATGRPVLMTGRDALPPVVVAELARRKPTAILLVGGTATLSPAVEAAARAAAPGAEVRRVAGADRYATAAALAARTGPAVYVASGTSAVDALAAGPAVAHRKGALLLVPPTGTPSTEVAALAGRADAELVAVGGTAAVPDAVIAALRPARVACLQGGSIPIGGQATFTVVLTAPAPPGGTRVTLLVDRAGVTSPAFVDVPAGATSATFTITADPGVSGPTTVRASAGGATVELPVSAGPFPPGLWSRPTISSFTASPTVRLSGEPTKLTWSVSGGTCAITPDVGTVPCTGTTTITPGSTKTYTLSATIGLPDAPASTSTVAITVPTSTTVAYVTDPSADSVQALSIDSSGVVSTLGAALPGGNAARGVVVDPLGRYAYVAANTGDQIRQFLVGSDGTLTANGTFATAVNDHPRELVIDPSGRWLYALYQAGAAVQPLTIGANGVLSANGGTVGSIGGQPVDIAMDPLGRFVYTVDNGTRQVTAFRVGADGRLTSTDTFIPAGTSASGLAVDPTGRFLYVGLRGAGRVLALGVDPTTGTLTDLGQLAFADGNTTVTDVLADPTGRYVYVTNGNVAVVPDVFAFRIESNGSLTALGDITLSFVPVNLWIDAGGRRLFATGSGNIGRMVVAADGTLSSLGANFALAGNWQATTPLLR